MTELEQRRAAKLFAQTWLTKEGYEKGETQLFWLELLHDVLGIDHPSELISFEVRVQLGDCYGEDSDGHLSYIDAVLPQTRVLIEQKSSFCDLNKKIKQSDGAKLSPLEQARRYDLHRPVSQHARYIVVCNFRRFEIYDCEQPNREPVVILLENLAQDFYRLRFLVSPDNVLSAEKKELSVQAGQYVSVMYTKLRDKYIDPDSPASLQSLNKLCVRLVFCLYAEDAGLFASRTQLREILQKVEPDLVREQMLSLFRVLNTKLDERDPYEQEDLLRFPFINGGLFHDDDIEIPRFDAEIVDLLLNKAGASFKWREISPTIFGAMFESTLNPETRRHGGMHYTSVENIHKVIDPLFLDALKQEFGEILSLKSEISRMRQLERFQQKLASLSFLDPACGSGNFLTEAYLSLRRLENDVIRARYSNNASLGAEVFNPIMVSIGQFYGIEVNDFAVSVARTALWIAENQMIQETCDIVGHEIEFFPLKSYPNIVEGNALTMPWEQLIPYKDLDFIIGNPPFSGARMMSKDQKTELVEVFGSKWTKVGDLGYVCAWFKKAADIMHNFPQVRSAFVATNSICQGTSVANLWEGVSKLGIEISFAHRSFQWDNEATEKAAVYCVIVGIQSTKFASLAKSKGLSSEKRIFSNEGEIKGGHINAYLTSGNDVFVHDRKQPLCTVPIGGIGNKPIDGGNYLFSPQEKAVFLELEPQAAPFFHRWYGAEEFINGKERFCLWLGDCSEEELAFLPLCRERIAAVRQYRLQSSSEGTRKLADKPTRFHVENMPHSNFLVVPEVTSSRRDYIPIGFMSPEDGLCSNLLKLFPDASLYHFAVLTSSVHMVWIGAVCGRLGNTFRYSSTLVYNNFPWPLRVSSKLKQQLEQSATKILQVRKGFSGYSLAQLYDPDFMPQSLRQAHKDNDALVMQAYGFDKGLTATQILSKLFAMYCHLVSTLTPSGRAQESGQNQTLNPSAPAELALSAQGSSKLERKKKTKKGSKSKEAEEVA